MGTKGYTQQQWENDFAREQWEYNKNRTDQSDALSAYQQAFNLYTQGAGDAASDVLNRYGLNANAFANYNGAPVTRDDRAGVLKHRGFSGGKRKSGSGGQPAEDVRAGQQCGRFLWHHCKTSAGDPAGKGGSYEEQRKFEKFRRLQQTEAGGQTANC